MTNDKERLNALFALMKRTQVTASVSFNGYVDIQLGTGQCFSGFTDIRSALDAINEWLRHIESKAKACE